MPEDEPDDLPDILERINANLKAIHSELEMQNKGAMRSNARLAVLIVVFAIPASFLVEVLSWVYVNEFLPYALDPATIADANGRELFIGLSGIVTLTVIFITFFYIIYKYFNPLITLLDDPELEEFIKEIKDEVKSKK